MEFATNQAVGEVLDEIAQLLELKGESSFRIRAYENAARTIRHMSTDLAEMKDAGQLSQSTQSEPALLA